MERLDWTPEYLKETAKELLMKQWKSFCVLQQLFCHHLQIFLCPMQTLHRVHDVVFKPHSKDRRDAV
jgi:hypothetical protein